MNTYPNIHSTDYDTIFSKIGGINALHEIVDRFYDKVLSDDSVSSFFKNTDMNIQRGKMKAFLMMALGGPVRFMGKDMREAHTRLVANGLSDTHFDTIGVHLDASLKEFGVDENIRRDVATCIEACRTDVLNK